MQIKTKDIPLIKASILEEQDDKCGICSLDLRETPSKNACLDHDHKTGFIRGVLCRNCNAMEGKIFNAARRAKRTGTEIQFLQNLIKYLLKDQYDIIHPTFKTKKVKK